MHQGWSRTRELTEVVPKGRLSAANRCLLQQVTREFIRRQHLFEQCMYYNASLTMSQRMVTT